MPPNPSVGQPLLVPDRDLEAGLAGQRDGLVGEPGGVLEVGRHRGERAGPPARPADRDRALQRGPVGVGQAGQHDPGDRDVLGRRRAPVRTRRSPGSRRPRTARGRPSGSTAGIVVATAARSSTARASAAPARRKSSALAAPSPTRSTWRSSALSGAPSGTGSTVTSPALPDAAVRVEQREQVDARAARRPRRRPGRAAEPAVRALEHRERDHVHAREGVRTGRRDGELGRRDLGRQRRRASSPGRGPPREPAGISRRRPSGRHRARPPPRR